MLYSRMDSKEAAAQAITDKQGSDVNGYIVRCSWGKEVGDVTRVLATPTQHMPMNVCDTCVKYLLSTHC